MSRWLSRHRITAGVCIAWTATSVAVFLLSDSIAASGSGFGSAIVYNVVFGVSMATWAYFLLAMIADHKAARRSLSRDTGPSVQEGPQGGGASG